jgi:ribosomal protein S18 acetylase RimI-like enzyme
MKNITIQTFSVAHREAVVALQSAYAVVYPDAPVIPAEAYLSPAFEGGCNVFCAIDESGKLVGYAPLYPVLVRDPSSSLPHTLWVEIKTHPACEAPEQVKDQLFERILRRAREVTGKLPGHPVHLTFQYFPSETASVEYVTARGCQYTESVFTLRRDLSSEIPALSPAAKIEVRPWRMESEAEQRLYVQARNECFPEAPIELEEWQYFMQSPQWSVGTTFAAFEGEELVGNVTAFWDEAASQRFGKNVGFTEYIFVRPQWRGRNIARGLINAGLAYLKGHGRDEAHLEVRARNRSALGLYLDLGYEVMGESRFYVLELRAPR